MPNPLRLMALALTAGAVSLCGVRAAPEIGVDNPSQTPADSCDIPIASAVTLSPAERCVLDAHKKRCKTHDPCIIDCLANRKDEFTFPDGQTGRIGGGCWHVCFAYQGIDWTLPDGVKACDTLPGFERIGSLLPNRGLLLAGCAAGVALTRVAGS